MTVGLVIVSHSAKIAEGTVDLARQMAADVSLEAAGGIEDGGIGTSFEKVQAALESADSGDGAVVLCDLGSAILTAETALEFLDDAARDRVRIADAPLVEGAVAAAVAAQTGGTLDQVLSAAESAGRGPEQTSSPATAPVAGSDGSRASATVEIVNEHGLHARPAAEFVKRAATFDAALTVNGVDAKSLLRIMALGLTRGADVEIVGTGPDAEAAVNALRELIESGFGEA